MSVRIREASLRAVARELSYGSIETDPAPAKYARAAACDSITDVSHA
jgi:hypothetical protein